jgi:Flp pilus assembly protein TadB
MERWTPRVSLAAQEKVLIKRLTRVRPLFGFLRLHRLEIFDDAFQEALESMYRTTGAGAPPHPPALLGMSVPLMLKP